MFNFTFKRVALRTLLLLASILAVTQAAYAYLEPGTKVYLKPGVWDTDGAWFALRFSTNSSAPVGVICEPDADEAGVYVATVPEGSYSYMEALRMSKTTDKTVEAVQSAQIASGEAQGYWNSFKPSIYAGYANNCFVVKSWTGYDWETLVKDSDIPLPEFKLQTNSSTNFVDVTRLTDTAPYKYTAVIPEYQSGDSGWIRLLMIDGDPTRKNWYFGPLGDKYFGINDTNIAIDNATSGMYNVLRVSNLEGKGTLTLNIECTDKKGTGLKVTSMSYDNNVRGEKTVKINGLDSDWANPRTATYDAATGKYILKYTCLHTTNTTGVADEVVHFRVNVDGTEYTTVNSDDLIIALGNARPFSNTGNSGSWWFYACEGGEYTITVDADANPMTVQVVQEECTHTPPHLVVTFTGLAHMWDITDYKRAPKDELGTYTYTHTAVQNQVWFRVRLNGREYVPAAGEARDITSLLGQPIEIGDVRVLEPQQNESAGYWYFNSTIGQQYTFTVSADGTTVTIYDAGSAPITSLGIPVVPARVKDRTSQEEWAKVSEEEPAVYLLAQVLNGQRPSNEWEMIKGTDGLYHLDGFTMRNTYIKQWGVPQDYEYGAYVRIYTSKDDNNTVNHAYRTFKPTYGNAWDNAPQLTPGRMYNATYDPVNDVLEFEDVNSTWEYTKDGKLYNAPPYMALIGYNFQQYGQNYETPRGGHTNEGWQESRIQFDENANVLYDTKNRVMYSTMYPPKYPTYFYLNVNGNIRELRTRNLRMNVYTGEGSTMVVKTGKEWKEFFTIDGELDPSYANLFSDAHNGGGHPYTQRLRDDDLYARYTVSDVWVLGSIKLWSGWTGTTTNDGQMANWSNHLNWGWGAIFDNEDGEQMGLNTPYQMGLQAGNFRFDQPRYFKSVELFYALDHNNEGNLIDAGENYSILYQIQGYGEPSIDAKTDADHTYATYELSIDNIPEQAKVTGFTVVRYNAATDKPCDLTGATVEESAAIVLDKTGEEIAAENIDAQFNDVYVFDADATQDMGLASGKYYYKLNVTFEDGTGVKHPESVMSPIVTIVNTIATTAPRAYQLVLNLDENIKDPNGKQYKYVTFSERYDNVYGCQFVFDENGESKQAGELHYEPISKDDIEDIQAYYLDGNRSQWTNKVLIFCEEPTALKNMKEDVEYTLGSYTLSATGYTLLFEQKIRRYKADGSGTAKYPYAHNSYAAVVTFDDYNFQTFQVIPTYNLIVDQDRPAGKYVATPTNFSYTFPVPYAGEEKFSVVSSGDTKDGFVVDCREHETKAAFDKEYEHTLSVEVPLGLMNVDPAIRSDVYALLDTQVETYVGGELQKYTLNVADRVENVENAIVLDNLDPNDWFTVENNVVKINEQNRLRIYSEYRNDVKGYPSDETWNVTYLVPTHGIVAPELSAPKVYRGIAKTGDNEYRQQLVLVSATLDEQNPTMVGDALMHHDDMHMLVKYNGEHLASTASEEDPMHRKNHLTSADHVCVLEESEPFHWYAEMDEAELVGTGEKKIETAYAYFFTPGKDVKGQGAMQITPAESAMTLAAAETPATHYMFVSPYSEAPAITDIMTSVDEIEASKAAVIAGKGWIEVNANNATVYDAEGIAVAGAGRTAVEPGVYVVRADGKSYKVVVK